MAMRELLPPQELLAEFSATDELSTPIGGGDMRIIGAEKNKTDAR